MRATKVGDLINQGVSRTTTIIGRLLRMLIILAMRGTPTTTTAMSITTMTTRTTTTWCVASTRIHSISGLVRNMETIFTKEKIFKAYLDCRKTKKNTANALKFEINREKNLFHLLRELQDRSYRISRHICFIVTEPKPREIFAADFRDRVVHHLLCNEIYELFEKDFIENSFANRMGKGTHKGVEKLKEYLKRKTAIAII